MRRVGRRTDPVALDPPRSRVRRPVVEGLRRCQTVAMPLSEEERRVIDEIERQFSIEAERERSAGARDLGRALLGAVLVVLASVVALGVGFTVHPLMALLAATVLFVASLRLGALVRDLVPAVTSTPLRAGRDR